MTASQDLMSPGQPFECLGCLARRILLVHPVQQRQAGLEPDRRAWPRARGRRRAAGGSGPAGCRPGRGGRCPRRPECSVPSSTFRADKRGEQREGRRARAADRIREHQSGDVIGAARRGSPQCGDLRPPPPKQTHVIRSTHWARHAGGSNGSAKYCVSRTTLPAWNSMMLTVLTRRPS